MAMKPVQVPQLLVRSLPGRSVGCVGRPPECLLDGCPRTDLPKGASRPGEKLLVEFDRGPLDHVYIIAKSVYTFGKPASQCVPWSGWGISWIVRPSIPVKPPGLHVYSGSSLAMATEAIMAS